MNSSGASSGNSEHPNDDPGEEQRLLGKSRKTIYIHIGPFKTGSTALQHFLDANRKRLKRAGFYVPPMSTWTRHMDGHPGQGRRYRRFWTSLPRRSGRCGSVVVSLENLSLLQEAEIEEIRTMLPGQEVKIVAYLRRYDTYIVSLYQELFRVFVKRPEHVSVEEFKKGFLERRFYSGMLRRWGDAFGRENLILRLYGEKGFDTVEDFRRLAGIDVPDRRKPGKGRVKNPSFPPGMIRLLQEFTREGIPDDFRWALILATRRAAGKGSLGDAGYAIGFDEDDRREIDREIEEIGEISDSLGFDGSALRPPEDLFGIGPGEELPMSLPVGMMASIFRELAAIVAPRGSWEERMPTAVSRFRSFPLRVIGWLRRRLGRRR